MTYRRKEVNLGSLVNRNNDYTDPTHHSENEKTRLLTYINSKIRGNVTIKTRIGAYVIEVTHSGSKSGEFLQGLVKDFPSIQITSKDNIDTIRLPYNAVKLTRLEKIKYGFYRLLDFLKIIVAICLFISFLYLQHLNKPKKYTLSLW